MKKLLGVAVLLVFGLSITACSNKVELKVKKESLDVEYGSQIDKNVATYLDNDKDVLKEVKLSGIPDNEKDKDYPATGEYTLTFTYKDDTKNIKKVKVNVKDTTAPEFKDIKDKYEVDYGKSLSTDDFKATDLSKVTITLEDKDVNYKKSGTYKATVIAKDESNNETKKEIEIVVKEEEKEETSSNQSNSSSSKSTSSSKGQTASTSKSSSSSSKATSSKKSNSSSSSSSNKSNGSSSSNKSTSSSEPALTSTYYISNLCGKVVFAENGIIYCGRTQQDVMNYFYAHGHKEGDEWVLNDYDTYGYASDNLIDGTKVWYIYVE